MTVTKVFVKGEMGPQGVPGNDGAPGLNGVDGIGSEAVLKLQAQLESVELVDGLPRRAPVIGMYRTGMFKSGGIPRTNGFQATSRYLEIKKYVTDI